MIKKIILLALCIFLCGLSIAQTTNNVEKYKWQIEEVKRERIPASSKDKNSKWFTIPLYDTDYNKVGQASIEKLTLSNKHKRPLSTKMNIDLISNEKAITLDIFPYFCTTRVSKDGSRMFRWDYGDSRFSPGIPLDINIYDLDNACLLKTVNLGKSNPLGYNFVIADDGAFWHIRRNKEKQPLLIHFDKDGNELWRKEIPFLTEEMELIEEHILMFSNTKHKENNTSSYISKIRIFKKNGEFITEQIIPVIKLTLHDNHFLSGYTKDKILFFKFNNNNIEQTGSINLSYRHGLVFQTEKGIIISEATKSGTHPSKKISLYDITGNELMAPIIIEKMANLQTVVSDDNIISITTLEETIQLQLTPQN